MSQDDPAAEGQCGKDDPAVSAVQQKINESLGAGESNLREQADVKNKLDIHSQPTADFSMMSPGSSTAALFGYKEEIKKKVRETLDSKQAYDVAMYYHETGWARNLATNHIFINATLAVISINAVYMAIDTDWNKAPSGGMTFQDAGGFMVMEQLFCVYFTVEWVVRFCAFKNKLDGRKDAWFVFDSFLVFIMVMETWVLPLYGVITNEPGELPFPAGILRIFRLLRLSRLMRMLRNLPELMILVKGMVTAMQSVVWVMCLQLIITYIFAIAFTQLCGNVTGLEFFFKNIPLSMWSLFIYGTCLDNLADFLNAIKDSDAGWFALPMAFIFIFLAALTVMNMLIGVLCDVVSEVAAAERDENRLLDLKDKMTSVMLSLDADGDKTISQAEFKRIMSLPGISHTLQTVDVDPSVLLEFGPLYFTDENEHGERVELKLRFEEFMTMILDLREGNQASVKSLLEVWLKLKEKLAINYEAIQRVKVEQEEWETEMDDKFASIYGKVDNVVNALKNRGKQ